jgi:hypothetical protein
MKVKLISPRWEKLPFQTPFNLAPLGLPTVAGHFPPEWEVELVDENVDPLALDDAPDWVGISLLLTAQACRGFEIADAYRARGIPVVMGGIHAALMPEQAAEHADAVVDGEVEGVWEELRADLEKGELKKRYSPREYPSLDDVPRARRDLLNRPRYEVRGVKMFDLVQATRGCTYNCYPCCVPKLRGTAHRLRPVADVIDEVRKIDNDRFFFVDNCLRQSDDYQRELFTALQDLKLAWVAHPISEEEDILRLAREAGAWYIYQAIDRISDTIRDRIRRFHDHGIGVGFPPRNGGGAGRIHHPHAVPESGPVPAAGKGRPDPPPGLGQVQHGQRRVQARPHDAGGARGGIPLVLGGLLPRGHAEGPHGPASPQGHGGPEDPESLGSV